jgi:hypothetical protein
MSMRLESRSSSRVDGLAWSALARAVDGTGFGVLPAFLSTAECERLRATYRDDAAFRSRVVMARHGFGRGEYKYFTYPLPPLVAELRATLYPRLAPIANRWNEALSIDVRYPEAHDRFLARCHQAGQGRPTPLLLRYVPDDYNCLHQDLYGEHVFPLQVAVLLSKPGVEFEGGEFVTTEGSGGEQRAEVVPLGQGDAVVFAVNERPVPGKRGVRRARMRHGVSTVRDGERYTVGIIFHDAP